MLNIQPSKTIQIDNAAYFFGNTLIITPDSQSLIINNGTTLCSISINSLRQKEENILFYESTLRITSCCLFPDGKHIAINEELGRVICVPLDNPKNRIYLDTIPGASLFNQKIAVAIHPNGYDSYLVAVITQDHNDIELYNLKFSPTSLISSDHVFIKTTRNIGNTKGPMTLVKRLRGHTEQVVGCTFNTSSKQLISYSMDKTIIIWDIMTGQPVDTLKGHLSGVSKCAFNSTGKLMVSSAIEDRDARIWSNQQTVSFLTHTTGLYNVLFSPDNQWILSINKDGQARLWNTHTGNDVAILIGKIFNAQFTPDSQRIVSCTLHGTINVWELPELSCTKLKTQKHIG